ncbi:hypothetical protein B0682_07775 [Moraxella lincolnii]|uniref:Uncharacterized protein n=2 Tax=Lwoffella lincolnii TaxID=90241 RepID=A0A1T0CBY0_9GAMM|nr:hypothetical protein B0682_07775 [Moraxella lincolnii]
MSSSVLRGEQCANLLYYVLNLVFGFKLGFCIWFSNLNSNMITENTLQSIVKMMMTKITLMFVCLATLVGCDSQNDQHSPMQFDANTTNTVLTLSDSDVAQMFVGCYTISHDEPAQIKISTHAGKLVMQMKEPANANRVWDNPEPLEILTKKDVANYFAIDAKKLDAIIARPDKLMVLAKVQTSHANLDPLLDSEYLAYIYRGANTIYKVVCDDAPVDIVVDIANAPQTNSVSLSNQVIHN